jgi:hypothetical protein
VEIHPKMSTTPEKIADILPRIRGKEAERVKRIEELTTEANVARQEYLAAGKRFAELAQQDADLLTDLMGVALEMHAAKVRVDAALASIRREAGLI